MASFSSSSSPNFSAAADRIIDPADAVVLSSVNSISILLGIILTGISWVISYFRQKFGCYNLQVLSSLLLSGNIGNMPGVVPKTAPIRYNQTWEES
jgi:hypothetical protein